MSEITKLSREAACSGYLHSQGYSIVIYFFSQPFAIKLRESEVHIKVAGCLVKITCQINNKE